MLEAGKIDGRQATYLMINTIVSEGILFVPAITFALARQDAWLSNVIALLGGLLIAWMWLSLSRRFPGKTLFEIFQLLLGSIGGKLVGFLYCWGWLHVNADVLREFTSLMVGAFMPNTPIIVFTVACMVLSSYASYSGLENIARVNQLFTPLIILSIAILYFLSTLEMDFQNLLPVYDSGFLPILKGSFAPMFWMGHIITLANLVPFLNKPQEMGKIAVKSILVSFLIFELVATGLVAIFGPNVASAYLAPVLNGARMIHLANFLERLEMILMIVWITGGMLKIALFQWVPALGLAQLLNLKSYRPLVVPAGIFIAALSIWLHPNVTHLFNFMGYIWGTAYGLGYVLVFPVFLLVIAAFKGGGKQT